MNSPLTRALTLVVLVLALSACAQQARTNATTNETNRSLDTVIAPVDKTDVETPTQEQTTENFSANLTFTEGDRIELKTLAVDPDNDDVELEFSRPFERDGIWQTEIGDAGDYPVTVIARDDRGAQTTQRILVTILFANRPPQIIGPENITVREGETVELDFEGTDPDEDEVLISYSGWMKGHTYTTSYTDAGEHTVTVIAEDGRLTTRKNITVFVENVNRPPVIETKADTYELVELQTLTVAPKVADPDGDKVTLTFGSPLDDKGRWTPQLDEAGEYTVTLSASDGTETTTKDIEVVVDRANRAPRIATASGEDNKVYVKEGDIIDLRTLLVLTDEENENITSTFTGWMTEPTYQTTYDDAGEHTVTVTIQDQSQHIVRQDIVVVVADVNRPPVFVRPA